MIHFDAHSDTYDSFFGSRYNHGTPFRRAIEENLLDPKRMMQIGIRGAISDAQNYDFARAAGVRIVFIEEFEERGRAGGDGRGARDRRRAADLRLLRHRRARSIDRAGHRHAGDRRHHDARSAEADPRARAASISPAPIWSKFRRRSIRPAAPR